MNKKYNVAFDLIHRNLENNSNKIAFIDDLNEISYAELSLKVQNVAESIKRIGFKEKDKVLICLNDNINYPIAFLGVIWAGVIPICINTLLPEKDLAYMLEDSDAKGIICIEKLSSYFLNYKNNSSRNLIVIVDCVRPKSNKTTLAHLINKNASYPVKTAITYEKSECFWLYSSGSTGSPKGTIHIHKSLVNTANMYAKNVLNINSKDIFFSAAKLFFAYGLGNALTFPMSVGGTSILRSGRPTIDEVVKTIKANKVSIFFGVPTLYAALLNSKLNVGDFKTLRLAISAGEALPANLCKTWNKLLNIKVLDGIGSTEMLHIFISNNINEVVPGASGRPVPGYEARLIKDNGDKANINEIGELEIKGPSAAIAYWNKPIKSSETFKGLWTKTGDKYIKDINGIYTYCGRADDMMKVSGQYVSPFEVEAALQNHKSVLEAAVVGHKDNNGLIKPKAFIVLIDDIKANKELENQLTNYIKRTLTPFKYPRWYEFVTDLPKTATGKIQRYRLRNL